MARKGGTLLAYSLGRKAWIHQVFEEGRVIGRQSFVVNWTIVPVHRIFENVVDALSSELLVQHRG